MLFKKFIETYYSSDNDDEHSERERWVQLVSNRASYFMDAIIRVGTAQEKQGIWLSIFPDRQNTENV